MDIFFEMMRGIAIESARLFVKMSPYLLFGFFFAGVLHVLISLDTIANHLGKSSVSSVLKSVIFGIPLPLCSCGVIPSAVLLRKKGASRGAVLSFLVATPITGVDSILATYSLLGPLFTIYRIVASSFTAFVTGLLANLIHKDEMPISHVHSFPPTDDDPTCCHEAAERRMRSIGERFVELFRYAFIELLGDIWKWLLVGILIGAVISSLIPDAFIQDHLETGWRAMLLMLVVGIPMYVCATGSIPIAAALILKGMSPGAALVFLLAGPATNAVTITVVSKELGRKAALLYVISISAMSILFGLLLDLIWNRMGISVSSAAMSVAMIPHSLEVASSLILAALIIFLIIRLLIRRFS